MRPAALQRVLLVSPGAFASNGGIQAYNRSLLRALHELLTARGGRCEVLLLEDADGQLDLRYLAPEQPRPRGFSGRRALFALAVLSRVRRWAPDLVIFAHVHFATLGLAARILRPGTIQWFIAYGIDAWEPLRGSNAAALPARRPLCRSAMTRGGAWRGRTGSPPERLLLLPCSLDPFWHMARTRVARGLRPDGAGAPLGEPPRRQRRLQGRRSDDRSSSGCSSPASPAFGTRSSATAATGPVSKPWRGHWASRVTSCSSGRLPETELAQAYARATLFALPSTGEGFGIVYLEAAAFAKPSLAAREGGSGGGRGGRGHRSARESGRRLRSGVSPRGVAFAARRARTVRQQGATAS